MNLLDLIPLWASISSSLLAAGVIYILLRCKVMRTIADPAILQIFQLIFTFFILMLIGLLQASDAFGMVLFFGIIVLFPPNEDTRKQTFTEDDWLAFSKFFVLVLLVMNAILIKEKGLLFLSDDIEAARQDFFKGWGIFCRMNQVGVGILTITAAFMWKQGSRKTATLFASFAAFLSMTLGGRVGLLSCLFAYGTYLHFKQRKISNAPLVATGIIFLFVTLGIFYLMYGAGFVAAFGYRILAECDGPVYFFHDKMYMYASRPLDYSFDQLATSLRLRPGLIYEPLGAFMLRQHFGLDTMTGPNPQLFVESHVLFHSFGVLWYAASGALFVHLRRIAHTPYSFYLVMFFIGPLLGDSQFAFYQLCTVIMILFLLEVFLAARRLLIVAARYSRNIEQEG